MSSLLRITTGWLAQGETLRLAHRRASLDRASSPNLRFRSAAFHPESSLSFSNPRAPIDGQEGAIFTKPNRSYRNGRHRRHTAIIYAPAPVRLFLARSREPVAGHRHYLGTTAEATPHPARDGW